MATLVSNAPPVASTPELKVVNGDLKVPPKQPPSCFMSTAIDVPTQQPITCGSDFQTHKWFKVLMKPSMVDDIGSKSVDMYFNVNPTAVSEPYLVFHKINNWTGRRLEGFVLEVGFGVGASFQKVSEAAAMSNLAAPHELGVGTTGYFDSGKQSNFSHGLFGPIESPNWSDTGAFSGGFSMPSRVADITWRTPEGTPSHPIRRFSDGTRTCWRMNTATFTGSSCSSMMMAIRIPTTP